MDSSFGIGLFFKKAAVTGATGFLGSHIVKLLLKYGITVRALVRNQTSSLFHGNGQVQTMRGDVRNREIIHDFLSGVDVVFHTAGLVTPWVRQAVEQYQINVDGTQNLIQAAEKLGIPIVCTSSIVVLNPFPPPVHIRVLDGNHYVKSKRIGLELIHKARDRGVMISTILPSGIVGPGDHKPTPLGKLIYKIMNGRGPRLSFNGGLHLIDVRDVAKAHIAAAAKGPSDYALPGEYWSMNDIYELIGELVGNRTRTLPLPLPILIAGSYLAKSWSSIKTHRPPILTPAWAHYFHLAPSMNYSDDSDKLGLSPLKVKSALTDEVSWFYEFGKKGCLTK